jgi:hypothetical protein
MKFMITYCLILVLCLKLVLTIQTIFWFTIIENWLNLQIALLCKRLSKCQLGFMFEDNTMGITQDNIYCLQLAMCSSLLDWKKCTYLFSCTKKLHHEDTHHIMKKKKNVLIIIRAIKSCKTLIFCLLYEPKSIITIGIVIAKKNENHTLYYFWCLAINKLSNGFFMFSLFIQMEKLTFRIIC